MSQHPIRILIPAYNAARSLPHLLERLEHLVQRDSVFVVDDGSTDDTSRHLEAAGISHLRHASNLGKGAALRTGFEHLLTRPDWDAVVTMDADLQHLPEDLPRLVECWEKGRADLVLGARRRTGVGMPLPRIVSNTITSFLVSARCGSWVADSQCGYRLLARSVVGKVRFDSDGYEAETELLIRALLLGFRVESVPVQTVYGSETTHMTPWATTRSFLEVLFREY